MDVEDLTRMIAAMYTHKLFNPARRAQIMHMRHVQRMTYAAIARELRVSSERIRYIDADTLRMVRWCSWKMTPEDFLRLLACSVLRETVWPEMPTDTIKLRHYVTPHVQVAIADHTQRLRKHAASVRKTHRFDT